MCRLPRVEAKTNADVRFGLGDAGADLSLRRDTYRNK